MAYSKLVKTVQDFALGIQSVNGARDNLEAFRTAWITEHGKEEPPSGMRTPANPYEALGRHNTPPIPRAVVRISTITFAPGQVGYVVAAQPTVLGVSKLGVGLWLIQMDAQLGTFWANAVPAQTSAATRFCRPVSYLPAGAGTPAGIGVTTYELGATTFAPADYSFTCCVYGYNATQSAAATSSATPFGPRTRPPETPRTLMFGRHR